MSVTRKGRRVLAGVAASTLLAGTMMAVSTTAVSAASKSGGTLIFVTQQQQLDHIDPTRVYTGRDIAFLNTYLFRTLVAYKYAAGAAGYTLAPDLATNTGVPSNKAKTWTWTLRPGVTWQDGSKITCADLKYGISREFAQDVLPDGPTYGIQYFAIPQNADGSSKYPGPYKATPAQAKLYDKAVSCKGQTITIKLNKSVADFNFFATYPAMSPVKKSKDTGEKYDLAPLSTGPYKIQQYKIGDSLTLVRNPKWNAKSDKIRTPYPDSVEVRFGIQPDVIDQMMKTDSIPNAVSFDGLLPQDVPAYFQNPSTARRGLLVLDPYTRYMAVNAASMNCLAARKALFFAWNTQAIIDANGGTKYYGVPGDNAIKPNLGPDYAPTTGNIHDPNWKATGNPAYVKTLLEQAKTQCPSAYNKLTNTGVSIDLPNTPTYKAWTPSISAAMKAAGIVVTYNFIPSGQYYSTIMNTSKQGDMSRSGWGADWANASTVIPPLFVKNGGFDLSQNWNDPAYPAFVKIVNQAMGETNRAKQSVLWHKAAQYAMDQYWILGVMFSKAADAFGSGVGGVKWWGPQGTFLFPTMYLK